MNNSSDFEIRAALLNFEIKYVLKGGSAYHIFSGKKDKPLMQIWASNAYSKEVCGIPANSFCTNCCVGIYLKSTSICEFRF